MHVTRLLYNSDSYVAFECKKYIIMCFSDKRLLLFTAIVATTNELSDSSILVFCGDQKFINVRHEKIDIKIEIAIFSKIKSKSNFSRSIKNTNTSVNTLFQFMHSINYLVLHIFAIFQKDA